MPISIEVRSERGVRLAGVEDIAASLPKLPPALTGHDLPRDAAAFPMLAYIDPYGDTCFNRLQTVAVLGELRELARREADGFDAVSLARAVEVLVAVHMQRPHAYLWFVGD